jgi:hypothetical protein
MWNHDAIKDEAEEAAAIEERLLRVGKPSKP